MDFEDIVRALRESGGLFQTLEMEGELKDGVVTGRMRIDRKHTGAPGVVHGGAIMALLDTTFGGAALVHALPRNRLVSTVEMKVNFLRPALEGETVVAEATLQSAGKSLLVITGTAKLVSSGEAVAFGVGTFNLFSPEKMGSRPG
ncbi:MAG: PaaI family thioesterase [Myxococcota bacterium]